MNRSIRPASILMCLVLSMAAAQGSTPAPGLPPLIERQAFFADPEIANARLSPNGRYLAFVRPWKGTRNIYVKGVSEPFSAAHLLTTETQRPIAGYFWTRDSRYILYVKDHEGDENFNVYAVDPASNAPADADAPPSRDLTGLKGVRVEIYDVPRSHPDVIYIGLNDRDKAWHDLYRLTLATGQRTLMARNTERVVDWKFDLQGRLRLAARVAEGGETQILRVDGDKLTPIYECSPFEACGAVRFTRDGRRVYVVSNEGTELISLMLLDPRTGKTQMVESDPEKRVDFRDAWFSEVSDELLMTSYTDAHERRYFHDPAVEADFHWLERQFPGDVIDVPSFTADEQTWMIKARSDVEPGEFLLFDRKTRRLTFEFMDRDALPRKPLAPMEAIEYPSSDGLVIPAYLTLPKGVPPKDLPTIILPHGGPWGRNGWGFDGWPQFFANRGYAVLQPNFRGSTGYGRRFMDAGNLEWGRRMQDDLTWGVKYLVGKGIADTRRVGIVGVSYGGYCALAGLTFTPELYAAGVDIVGPSNLARLLDTIPPYWEAGRAFFHLRLGNPDTPEGKAMLMERSPLTHADRIRAPLLIAQGANDPRVNREESESVVVALRDRGFPVQYLLAPDEGHGFARPINNLALMMAVEKFLALHLGGRYQESGTPETIARLRELTVDPRSVTLKQ